MPKVVYSDDFGSFGGNVPYEIFTRYNELAGTSYKSGWDIEDKVVRHDKHLVQSVEEYLKSCDAPRNSSIKIHLIKGNRYRIDEYDGMETVMEPHEYNWVEVEDE
jgi:hypothetical protein